MNAYRGPKCRIERRLGKQVFGRAKNILLKKSAPPGMHSTTKKKTAYRIILEAKQVCSYYYGRILKKQMIKALKLASTTKMLKQGSSGTIGTFAGILESRLESVVRRLGFADTNGFSRQLISHGKILINDKKVNIKSFMVTPGTVISLSAKARKMKRVEEARERSGKDLPSYLSLSDDYTGKMEKFPSLEDIPAHAHGIVDYQQAVQHIKKHL